MKAKILAAFTIVLLLVGALLILLGILGPVEYLVPELTGDIEWSKQVTRLKLRKYEIVGRPEELRSWLYHQDGAPGQEVGVAFLSWGLDNQSDFEMIVDGMAPAEKPGFISWLSGIIVDRKFEDSFRSSFSERKSPAILEILSQVGSMSNGSRR
ncbi:MAG: hypothetical protein IPM25_09490 [Chloracidobacterium sp.]|nr:hypothetical protein [Chloracidobacterium sp.]